MIKKIFSNRANLIIALIIIFGVIYRLVITANGNFLFNMDNARDMVDVREMVELHKLRLIGPTSGIEGLYTGPGWYYLLAIPYIISDGDPYASIIMEIILWATGGVYLLKITQRWGYSSLIAVGSLWVASNFILLANVYAFNPNPIIFLTPIFIYYFEKYLKEDKLKYSVITFMLAGSFFQFEMAYGIFMFPVIVIAILLSKKRDYLLSKNFTIGVLIYGLFFLPQLFFDFRHQFLSVNAILKHLSNSAGTNETYDLLSRWVKIRDLYRGTYSATLMNSTWLTIFFIFGFFLSLIVSKYNNRLKDNSSLLIISVSLVLVPFVGYILLPINVYAWHIGGGMVAGVLLVGYIIFLVKKFNRPLGYLAALIILLVALNDLNLPEKFRGIPKSGDQSTYVNEIAAIDYAYKKSEGKDFKFYVYLSSVIDYPYQYLIWWYGLKEYGYLPSDYAYLPYKPKYISNKESFSKPTKLQSSNLVFLIKESDTNNFLVSWEDNFEHLETISVEKVGPLVIEIKKEP